MFDPDAVSPVKILLQVVGEVFEQDGLWPIRQYVQAVLDQDHHLDLNEVLQEAPRSLVYSAGEQESSEVILTVAGLVAVGNGQDAQRFIEALGWCVAEQLGFRPIDPTKSEEVRLGADHFENEWASRGQKVTSIELSKLRAMFITEGIYSSIGGEGASWTMALNRQSVLPYRDVQTIDDYLAIKEASMRVVSPPPSLPLQQVEEQPLEPAALSGRGLAELPPRLREACAILFANGHFPQGVLEAVKVMGDLLREVSGLALDGDQLAGRVFNPENPIVVVGDLSTETGRSRQRGLMLITQGIFGAVRNPLAHQRIVLRPSEASQMMALIAFVVEAVEGRREAAKV